MVQGIPKSHREAVGPLPWRRGTPEEQQIQHLPRGGEPPAGGQEGGHEDGVAVAMGRHQVVHQLLQYAWLQGPHPTGLLQLWAGLIFTLSWYQQGRVQAGNL